MKNLAIWILLLLSFFSFNLKAYSIEDVQKTEKKVVSRAFVENKIAEYTRQINSNPESEDGYINRAYLNYLLGNIEPAIKDYSKLIELNPRNEDFYLNRGYLNHISNNRVQALKDYDAAIKINPKYAFAYNNLGVALSELGRNKESLAAYDTAISIDPNYADAYFNRGNLKTSQNKNEEALEDFNSAIKLNPTDAATFNNRGVVKRKLNYNVGALSDFSIAIRLDPEDITAYANRGRLKKRYFDSEGAEEDFKSAISAAQKSPDIIKEIETQKILAKEHKSTTASIVADSKPQQPKAVEQKKPQNVDLQSIAYTSPIKENKLAVEPVNTNNIVKKDYNESENIVQAKVTKIDMSLKPDENLKISKKPAPKITTKPVENPKLAECYYIRALQKYILQNREGALKDFDMAIAHNPNYAEAYYYRAAIKRDLNDDGFVEDYQKAVKINPALKSVKDADVLTILKI